MPLLLLALVVGAPAAQARDPGRWLLTGVSSLPISYWQGLSSDGRGGVVFAGVFEGLWGTTLDLRQTRGVAGAIPPAVGLAEGYNHIGDIGHDGAEGGRLLLPLECYPPGQGNTCATGSIGVADPATLAWRYHVRLSTAEIAKAMWVEPSPDGRLLWTSSGADLLAFAASDVSPANAAPAPPIGAARRLAGAVPPSGVSGAAFWRGRLLLAGQQGARYQVWAVDLATGRRTLELELGIRGESEGLETVRMLGGELQWLIAPFDPRGSATYGPGSALLHLVPAGGRAGLRVSASARTRGRRVQAAVRVTRRGRPWPAPESASAAASPVRTAAGARASRWRSPAPVASGRSRARARCAACRAGSSCAPRPRARPPARPSGRSGVGAMQLGVPRPDMTRGR